MSDTPIALPNSDICNNCGHDDKYHNEIGCAIIMDDFKYCSCSKKAKWTMTLGERIQEMKEGN